MTIRLKFPHIPRIISARVCSGIARVFLWGCLISLISLNVLSRQQTAFALPVNWADHRALAEYLWVHGSREAANRELAIAREMIPPNAPEVLGTTSWKQEPARSRELIAYWKDVAANRPDYRDAYIQLAALSYSQGDLISTKSYLDTARGLDPNGTAVGLLEAFITKQLK